MDSMIKNVKHVELNISIVTVFCFLEQTNSKGDLIEYKCLCCNKSYQRKFDEHLSEQLFNTNKFSNHGNNKFFLFL